MRAPDDSVFLCESCRRQLIGPPIDACSRCGAAVARALAGKGGCESCRGQNFQFRTVIGLGHYADELRSAVLQMKSPSGEPLSIAMGRLLVDIRRPELQSLAADLIVPIPMHWTRRMARGANSPELLAGCLGRALKVRVALRALVRRRRTSQQNRLLPEDRAENVRGAFRLSHGRSVRGARVLLVDDILTTGSTADEAAGIFRREGATDVAVAILARADGFGHG